MKDDADLSEPIDLASIFLGPKGENADVFESLLLEAFRDHVFWRRNFHPEDGFLVEETQKKSPAYERSITVLRQELLGLLSELKAGVPFFSPRYIGHMNTELTMASLIGYFATLLYNPNNVAAEASPVTSRMEAQIAAQLATMIGYSPDRQWGHLTSGGTVANFEALWVARNVKYLPVALRWATEELGSELEIELVDGGFASIRDADLWQLLNVSSSAALDAADLFRSGFEDPDAADQVLNRHSLAGLGYQDFGRRLANEFTDALPPAVVLVPSTAHYSWEKICRSLGIGGANLLQVPVDDFFRMDTGAFEEALGTLGRKKQPVIACVPVIGTTEESAIDRLREIVEVRGRVAKSLGMAFHLHADAAYGGYAAAISRRPDGSRRNYGELIEEMQPEVWPEPEVFESLCALEHTDSVTIDPHKLGFVPYPAGAISIRDGRARELVAVEAPYVFHRGASEWGYIGRYIFEGSKPGAAASAVWLSHKVLPLHAGGYGRLIGETARGARRLHRRLIEGDWSPFRLVTLPAPDLNIVCFGIGHPAIPTLEATNQFTDRLYQSMSVGSRPHSPDYYVTKTVLRAREYGSSALPIVRKLGFSEDDYLRAGGLSVIRCTSLDPFLGLGRGRTNHIESFAAALRERMEKALTSD